MTIYEQHRDVKESAAGKATLLLIGAVATFVPCGTVLGQVAPESSSDDQQGLYTLMPEELRTSVRKVVVIAGQSPTDQQITGSYDKETLGLTGGMDAGTRAVTISKDVGPVPVNVPIPMLSIPASIIGGLSGAAQREIQELRDALTEDLAREANQPLTSDGLATDVYHGLRRVPRLDAKIYAPTIPIPDDTEAVLFVNVDGVTIDVQGKEAILTTTATATLRRVSDGRAMYNESIQYQDRDTLGNWTEDNSALWRVYANFSRHYLGREISGLVFGRVELEHELRPKETSTVSRKKKNDWQGVSKSTTPTLAWKLDLNGGDPDASWVDDIDESEIYYDLEIYDTRTLVYAEEHLQATSHTLAYEIEGCKNYRWSVRPSYQVGSDIMNGEWMRFTAGGDDDADVVNGNIGKQASEAPAYVQYFASLEIKCGRR